MEIRVFGIEERVAESARLLSDRRSREESGRLILLPIPTSIDGLYIKGTDYTAYDIAALTDSETVIIGYNIPSPITDKAEKVGARIFDALHDEQFLSDNAELTARGALGYILTGSKKDIADMHIGIVGYGRIGMRLLRLLLFFGAKITLYTTRPEVALEMGKIGVSACAPDENADLSGLDILINTAPARQINPYLLDQKTQIIDLASGNVFRGAERLTLLSAVPAKYYPLSAGRVYAERAFSKLFGGEL